MVPDTQSWQHPGDGNGFIIPCREENHIRVTPHTLPSGPSTSQPKVGSRSLHVVQSSKGLKLAGGSRPLSLNFVSQDENLESSHLKHFSRA